MSFLKSMNQKIVLIILILAFLLMMPYISLAASKVKTPKKVTIVSLKSSVPNWSNTTNAKIKWKKVKQNTTGYQVYQKQGKGKWALKKTTGKNTISVGIAVTGGKTYKYKIRAINKKKVNGKTIVKKGKFSAVKSIKVKPYKYIKQLRVRFERPKGKNDIVYGRFKNISKKDIAILLSVTLLDKNGLEIGSCSSEQLYLKAGDEFIEDFTVDRNFYKFDCDYLEVKNASESVKKYYEATPFTTKKNYFGGIDYHLTDNTHGYGYNDIAKIFYKGSDGKILGHDEVDYGGVTDFDHTFESPGYRYSTYVVIRTKV